MNLAFGDISVRLNLPEGRLRTVISPTLPTTSTSASQLIAVALDQCAPHFGQFRIGERVVIVTSDITRYTGSEQYLPLLVDELNRRGIQDRDITILIALGIHRKQTEAEHRRIVGPLYDRLSVVDHDCDNPGKLVTVGRTSNGIDVTVNRLVVEADRLILTGTIGFHYFAGFSGGRKALLPGVAGRKSCLASHFAVLHPEPGMGRHPQATTGILDGNPVHEALCEACSMVGPDLIFNTILSPDKMIVAVFAGQWDEAHRAGCRFYAEHFSYPLREQADLVIASCGGFPKDINLIQSHKAMEYASRALKEGGVMILLAQCCDGYGNPTFFNWFRHKELPEFETALRAHYEINGQTAYALLDKAKRFRIILVSDLPPAEVRAMSLFPAATLDEALVTAEQMLPTEYSAYVIPEAGTVLPVPDGITL
jgi:nickel-dependent lactate racemase